MFDAYRGDEPFAFVSYAHADRDVVFPELERLHELGVRIWYDEGIELGNLWSDEIGRALASCSLFLVFISPRSVASRVVQKEVNFALNREKPFLAIHLEETQLPYGLELRMGDLQALLRYEMAEDHYRRKLDRSLRKDIIQLREPLPPTPRKHVGVAPRGPAEPAVSLQFKTPAGERNVCLCAGHQVRLGKDRTNDFVLRVLPRSPENDHSSRRISGQHAALIVEGPDVVWRNADCSNGTLVDGRPLAAREQAVVTSGTTIRPADVLPLAIDVFDGPYFDTPADVTDVARFAVSPTAPARADGPVNAVRLRREDELRNCEEYMLIHRGALLGRGPTCAVTVDDPSISNCHARLYALSGGLWMEPVDRGSIVVVDGNRLAQDELAALIPGSVITCGNVTINVTHRFQHSLGNIDCT